MNSETTQHLVFIFITTEQNSYFPSYKAWKNNYGMQLFKFFKYFLHFELLASNTIKMKVFI